MVIGAPILLAAFVFSPVGTPAQAQEQQPAFPILPDGPGKEALVKKEQKRLRWRLPGEPG